MQPFDARDYPYFPLTPERLGFAGGRGQEGTLNTQIRKEEDKKQGLPWMDKIMHHLQKTLAVVFA